MSGLNKRLVVVLGMHRSGTSAITRALNVFGVELGERLMPPVDWDNAKGYFEDIDLNLLNVEMLHALATDWHCLAPIEPDDVDSLYKQGYFLRAVALIRQKIADAPIFGFKDPRVAKLLPFWHQVFLHCGFDVGYVLVVRNPLSVVQSLAKRSGFNAERSYMLWLGHVLTSLSQTEKNRRVLVDYDHFLQASQQDLRLIAKRLALKMDAHALQLYQADFLDTSLRHSVYDLNDLIIDQNCPPLVYELYAALLDVALDNKRLDDAVFHAETVRWHEEFRRFKLNFRWIDQLSLQIAEQNQTKLILETQLHEANGREQALSLQLLEMQQLHVQENDALSQQFSAWEQTHITELASTRQQFEAHLIAVSEREKAISLQLQEMQLAHEQKREALSDEHNSREQALFAELAQSRQQLEAYLLDRVGREVAIALQLQGVYTAHDLQKEELRRQYDEREQDLRSRLLHAQQQLELQLQALLEREKAYANQLQELQQAQMRELAAQSHSHAAREQSLEAQLQAQQEDWGSQAENWASKEQAQAQVISQLQQEINAFNTRYSLQKVISMRNFVVFVARKNSRLHKSPNKLAQPQNSSTIPPIPIETLSSPATKAANDRVSEKPRAYRLDELLAYDDEHFINNAYKVLLGRAPDPEGHAYYLARLRIGISKPEILAQLIKGHEGRSRRVKVFGLNKAVRHQKWKKIPVLGRLLLALASKGS